MFNRSNCDRLIGQIVIETEPLNQRGVSLGFIASKNGQSLMFDSISRLDNN